MTKFEMTKLSKSYKPKRCEKQRFQVSQVYLGFSLLEVLLALVCFASLSVLLLGLYIHLNTFSKKLHDEDRNFHNQLMIQQWLKRAQLKAGFLGCQANTAAFKAHQTEASQDFLSRHPPSLQSNESKGVFITEMQKVGMPKLFHSVFSSSREVSRVFRGARLQNHDKVLEVQYLAVKPWHMSMKRVHEFEVNIGLYRHPGAIIAMADCHTFKIVSPIRISNFSDPILRWQINDTSPYLDPIYTIVGEWQTDSYYLNAHGQFYKKENPGKTQLLIS